MKALKVFCLSVLCTVMVASTSLAAEAKIAYFDLAKVFDNYQKTKEFDAVLQSQGEAFQKTRDAMIQKIQDAQNKLALMSDAEKTNLQADIDKQKDAVIAYDKQKREELTQRRDDKVREILGDIQGVVTGIAKKDGYTFVLNNRVLVYGDPQYDITSEVMKSLNESYKQ
ncbi:MAG: OmpH family outer membrane protein [Candidatus Omnitrophica bacterium]|nr:OmpH family outer membrane protein [Candidatus Omnitrophota bacterium]MDE2010008.1 OmpH family outer membrane protein [Candidatus Omnitrophota bacterium]MDE2215040.1 OmpH family outer membrane protein [Candidatus Omnitrophota bacterium]MDE2231740.1 OmpH family outer membrane protein [Candidatus Omnitrophota bacterium]